MVANAAGGARGKSGSGLLEKASASEEELEEKAVEGETDVQEEDVVGVEEEEVEEEEEEGTLMEPEGAKAGGCLGAA